MCSTEIHPIKQEWFYLERIIILDKEVYHPHFSILPGSFICMDILHRNWFFFSDTSHGHRSISENKLTGKLYLLRFEVLYYLFIDLLSVFINGADWIVYVWFTILPILIFLQLLKFIFDLILLTKIMSHL